MPLVKVKEKYQVTIPASIREQLALNIGDLLEAALEDNQIVLKPKVLVDPDDILTPEDEASVLQGEAQLKRGEGVPWEEVKKRLKL